MAKQNLIYKINRTATQCVVYECDSSRRLLTTATFTPPKGKTKRERYDMLSDKLRQMGLIIPSYDDKDED